MLQFVRNVQNYCTAQQATGENTMRRMRFACWIITDTATYPEYVIHMAFPVQQWLGERVST
jgi:formylmethanofuran dehydrogenase subunit E-like metal-binding protein